ncbi:MAG: OmpA family protein [Gammaproteobacteria bacterium]
MALIFITLGGLLFYVVLRSGVSDNLGLINAPALVNRLQRTARIQLISIPPVRSSVHGEGFPEVQFGAAALRPRTEETLTELVSVLENNPDIRVRLEGYTDNVGQESSNEMLSQKRAESVKDYLVSEGIDASRIKTIGLGERNPIDDRN